MFDGFELPLVVGDTGDVELHIDLELTAQDGVDTFGIVALQPDDDGVLADVPGREIDDLVRADGVLVVKRCGAGLRDGVVVAVQPRRHGVQVVGTVLAVAIGQQADTDGVFDAQRHIGNDDGIFEIDDGLAAVFEVEGVANVVFTAVVAIQQAEVQFVQRGAVDIGDGFIDIAIQPAGRIGEIFRFGKGQRIFQVLVLVHRDGKGTVPRVQYRDDVDDHHDGGDATHGNGNELGQLAVDANLTGSAL